MEDLKKLYVRLSQDLRHHEVMVEFLKNKLAELEQRLGKDTVDSIRQDA